MHAHSRCWSPAYVTLNGAGSKSALRRVAESMRIGGSAWYLDPMLLASLPIRYRLYASYWRLLARGAGTVNLRGGSFLLRVLRGASTLAHRSTIVPVSIDDDTVLVMDFADGRALEMLHEVRGQVPECAMISSVLTPGDTFIDVGANFGTLSLYASRIVGTLGKVLAVEPQPRLAGFIRESLRASRITNCEVLEVACGATASDIQLLIPRNDSGRAGFFPEFSGKWEHGLATVRVTTLDTIATSSSFSGNVVIKIDVEGSESAVLEGARQLIADRKPPLLMELNPWSARAAGQTVSGLLEKLSSMGYQKFSTDLVFPRMVSLDLIPLDKQSNLLALQ